ncbi:uncharacterized protein N7529_000484 [Penicillium soppii]|uniref:uncharacterized protein n=1 Tax=Penicillium soppii TaxID=69789 RepID=UPI002549115F|nr:uncharacterized protein N7529_000484 [Penicillium soppii]KAJ5881812.1 hypothetical protein N7529_000484 [Penicillium soppii]
MLRNCHEIPFDDKNRNYTYAQDLSEIARVLQDFGGPFQLMPLWKFSVLQPRTDAKSKPMSIENWRGGDSPVR